MNSEIKWIFFDVGSTLFDESAVYENRIEKIIQDNNIDKNEFITKVKQRAQINQKPIVSVAEDYNVKIPAWRHDLEVLYPDVKEILPKLYQKYKLGIIANQDFGTEKRLAAFGIRQYFDLVIASAEKGISKPNLRIFQIALTRANCKPEAAIMIGDRIDNDIVPANKIGMKTVWIKQGPGSSVKPNKIEEYPNYTINNLSELLTLLS
ncbi:HAD-IIIA family hydrolase [Streptococcus sp. NLN76]|uniref:HAD family hydrolase n=1 Tax=Streptococcus sp. NLN76 TaxID=2822800 RepID=UPI0018AA0A0B|nr:HAD-IIIA family hydrolase [Streptococcus sp. NLN76]MBF8970147.1 HAD-IIIA family hydrolase [Streptococcus sp. NLN76]